MSLLRHGAPIALPLLAGACLAAGDLDVADHHAVGDEPIGTIESALEAADPVSAAVTQSCTTASVKGLATQLMDEIQCMKPGAMKRIDGVAGLSLGDAVFPYLQAPAADALVAAQRARGVTMTINSGLRTLPQQYLLYRWYQARRCGIGLAAKPGTSNHESAIAVDIDDNAGWRPAMTENGFRWLGASDPVHFDYVGGGTIDMKGLSILAFQQLWNRNNPDDAIAEDGEYGPATEARVAKSPVGGFPIGADCSKPEPPPDAGDATEPVESPTETEAQLEDAPPDEGGCACALAGAPLGGRAAGAALAAVVGAALLLRRRR